MRVILPNTISSVDGSFSRASVGTYYDADGIIQTAAINEIRFDTDPDPVTLLFKGLLYEESRQNLCTHSEDFSNAAWTKTECTTSVAAGNAPDGTVSSHRLVENTTAGALRNIQDSISWISGNTYTISAYVKEDGTSAKRYVGLFVPSAVMTTATWVIWNLATGLVTGSGGTAVASKLQKLPNGWNRIELTVTAQVTTAASMRVFFSTSSTDAFATWTGDNSSGIFVWGVQAEKHELLSSIRASSYIKTTGSTVTRSADVVTGDGLVFTTVTDATAVWLVGTTYAITNRVRYSNKIWESAISSNTGITPGTDATKWIEVGPDNMHAAIDNMISTESTATTEMTFVVRTGSIDSVALLNVVADTVKVCLTDPVTGNVYYNTYGLAGVSVFDWQQYFFYDPLLKRTQIVLSNLPQYANGLVTIRLQTTVGETVKLAQALFGTASELGLTQYGARAGIIDYSRKEVDQFGNITFVERNFSKRLSVDVFVSNVELNRVQTLLYAIRAKPSVWVATDNQQFEEALIIYGFYKDFSTTISYPSHSICSLEIEGLT